jgi:hypothetical protein
MEGKGGGQAICGAAVQQCCSPVGCEGVARTTAALEERQKQRASCELLSEWRLCCAERLTELSFLRCFAMFLRGTRR